MFEITMNDQEFEFFMGGGEWYLSGETPGFDPWEQKTGRIQITVNEMIAEVFCEFLEPYCSCCVGNKSTYEWYVVLT